MVVRAFLSYSHVDRICALETKSVLRQAGVEAFLAHDDLTTSEEWKGRIIEELKQCNVFVPLLSENFKASDWAPQEAGFIASRPEVVIAPLSIDGTVPFGFFAHVQSGRSSEVVRDLLCPLAKRFPRTILPFLIRWATDAGSFRGAETKIEALVPFFSVFVAAEAQAFAEAAAENNQIWPAQLCRDEYLPRFIALQGEAITPRSRRALEYQMQHQSWYPGDDIRVEAALERGLISRGRGFGEPAIRVTVRNHGQAPVTIEEIRLVSRNDHEGPVVPAEAPAGRIHPSLPETLPPEVLINWYFSAESAELQSFLHRVSGGAGVEVEVYGKCTSAEGQVYVGEALAVPENLGDQWL